MPLNRTALTILGIEPMRVGGAEMYCRELSEQLGHHGWKSVLCFASDPPERVRRYLELPNVRFEKLNDPWRVAWQPTRDLMAILRRYRPSILHSGFMPFLTPYPWMARLCGVNQVYFTDYGSHPAGYQPVRAGFIKRMVARAINWPLTRVLCVSDYNTRCIRDRGLISEKRIHCLYEATAIDRDSGDADEFRRRYSIPEGRSIVAQVSWIIPEKGIEDVIAAARLVIRQNDAVHFVVVGEGEHRPRYMKLARQAGIDSHITWTGLVRDPVGDGVYAACDIACQPSRWHEAFGWTIIEAMACRKPVIATNVGGIPEIVQDRISGFLVPPSNPAALAEKILVLLGNAALRESMGIVGRATVETKFNLKRNIVELLKIYDV